MNKVTTNKDKEKTKEKTKEKISPLSPLEIISPLSPLEIISPLEQEYLDQLTPHQKIAYCIAKSHLGTSFSLKKSNGYILLRKV